MKPGEDTALCHIYTVSSAHTGKIFTVEIHHQRGDLTGPGDNVDMNIKGSLWTCTHHLEPV